MATQSEALTPQSKDYYISYVDFESLPEECITTIISLTTPRDACRLALISKTIKYVANCDYVWDNFLPSDYRQIVSKSSVGVSLLDTLSKKQLFLYLVDHPLLLNNGTMIFSLEKLIGKKCYTIGARNLSITWGDTQAYWDWHQNWPNSRFFEVARLKYVWWLEIKGVFNTSMLSPKTSYDAYLIFDLLPKIAFGFEDLEIEVMVETIGERLISSVYLVSTNENNNVEKLAKKRKDGWLEVKIGNFLTLKENEDVNLSFKEVVAGTTKGGLVVEGFEIRPTDFQSKCANENDDDDEEVYFGIANMFNET